MGIEEAAGVQDLPKGARGPTLLTRPADLGCTVEPHIFSVVLGRLGQGPCREVLDTSQAPGPSDTPPRPVCRGTALHSSNYSYYEYSIIMTIITVEASFGVMAKRPDSVSGRLAHLCLKTFGQ